MFSRRVDSQLRKTGFDYINHKINILPKQELEYILCTEVKVEFCFVFTGHKNINFTRGDGNHYYANLFSYPKTYIFRKKKN